MKLSKTSWHYRFNVWLTKEDDIPKNLCAYFWRTAIILFIFTAIAIVGVGMLYELASITWVKKGTEQYRESQSLWIAMGVITGVMLLILLLATDNLLSKFLKAKIGKYCPKIEWKDKTPTP